MARRFMASVQGSESAESVVALPLVCLVIFTGLEFGWMALRSLQVDAAARAGARQAAMAGVSASAVEQAVTAALRRSGMSTALITIEPSDPAQAAAGEVVSVRVAVNYADVGLIGLARLMPLPDSVSGRASMVKEPGP